MGAWTLVQQHLTTTIAHWEVLNTDLCREMVQRLCWPDNPEKQRPGGDTCAVKFTRPGQENWLAVDQVAEPLAHSLASLYHNCCA